MNVLEVIHEVEAHGGRLAVEAGELKVRGAHPLPEALMAELRAQKPAIMIALGVPLDQTVASILQDIRPYLSPALRQLPDSKLLALVNWHIIVAWQKAVEAVTQ